MNAIPQIEQVKNEMMLIPLTKAEISARMRTRKRGEQVPFRPKGARGSKNPNWRGGFSSSSCVECGSIFSAPRWEMKHRRYCSRLCYWRARLDPNRRRIRVHDKIAEKVLGKILPSIAVVHHINHLKKDNRNSNLIICENQAYHLFLHARERILKVRGNPNTDKICSRCNQVKSKKEFHFSKRGDGYRCYCKPCQTKYANERKSNGILN